MGRKSERDEWHKAWDVIRGLPEYKEDFKQSQNNKTSKGKLEKKWGFTLNNPEEGNPSFDFFVYFKTCCESNQMPRDEVIRDACWLSFFYEYEGIVYDGNDDALKDQTKPKYLDISVDLKAPVYKIKETVEALVLKWRDIYKIKQRKTDRDIDYTQFLIDILKRIGYTKKDVHRFAMTEEKKKLKYCNKLKLAEWKKIHRYFNKVT